MPEPAFLTKEELIRELGISKSTFYRWLRALDIKTSGRLLSAKEARQIREALGHSINASTPRS